MIKFRITFAQIRKRLKEVGDGRLWFVKNEMWIPVKVKGEVEVIE